MPILDGQWYRVTFVSDISKWPGGQNQPTMYGGMMAQVAAGNALVVRGRSNGFLNWSMVDTGPFQDGHFTVISPLPSVTFDDEGTSQFSFCKTKTGELHMWNSENGRIRILSAENAAALKAFL